jgi:hypothetical protein
MYWCDVCELEIPAAEVFQASGGLFHRKGSDSGLTARDADRHAVRQLADTHEPVIVPD